mmetsp:Transcript_27870/g.34406  ORF Transcript_27870/g.34406 Transcript_27870/m.34406 type:complete len:114 (-) Transcript_27870:232-573(-)
MKQASIASLLLLFIISVVYGFVPTSIPASNVRSSNVGSSTKLFFFGQPKDDGSPGDYLCKDCGYVFTKGPAAWAKLDDKYQCPPCGAPKFRFKKVPKGSESGKVEVKKSWFGN